MFWQEVGYPHPCDQEKESVFTASLEETGLAVEGEEETEVGCCCCFRSGMLLLLFESFS